MVRLGFLASRGGSSMRAIVDACRAGDLAAEPALLVCNNAGAPALAFADGAGLPSHVVDYRALGEGAADAEVARLLQAETVDIVVLSGFLRKLGPATLGAFGGRILNIHPSLLPRHGGHGLYGRRVHASVHAAGDRTSGATVHLVDEDYDTGAVLAQAQVELEPGDTPEDIERKVTAIEPALFVSTLKAILAGDVKLR